MTDVVHTTTSTTPWNSLVGDPNFRRGIPEYVRPLNSPHRSRQLAPLPAVVIRRERAAVRVLSRIRAWMVVPVVDFAMMLAPLAWRPPQIYAIVTMAVLATLLLTGGGRYVAPLHLSVLDELPSIVTRLLTAVAAVSAVILYTAPEGAGPGLPRNRLPGHRFGHRWPCHHHSAHCHKSPKRDYEASHCPDWGRAAGHGVSQDSCPAP